MSDIKWEPGNAYRVILADGTLWLETSSRAELDEALERVPMGYLVEQQYIRTAVKWQRVSGGHPFFGKVEYADG